LGREPNLQRLGIFSQLRTVEGDVKLLV